MSRLNVNRQLRAASLAVEACGKPCVLSNLAPISRIDFFQLDSLAHAQNSEFTSTCSVCRLCEAAFALPARLLHGKSPDLVVLF